MYYSKLLERLDWRAPLTRDERRDVYARLAARNVQVTHRAATPPPRPEDIEEPRVDLQPDPDAWIIDPRLAFLFDRYKVVGIRKESSMRPIWSNEGTQGSESHAGCSARHDTCRIMMTWKMDNGKGTTTGLFLAKCITPRRPKLNGLAVILGGGGDDLVGRIVQPKKFYRDEDGHFLSVDVVDREDTTVKYNIPCKYLTMIEQKIS